LTDVAVANAIGSNIANTLLIVGFSAILAKKLVINKNLIDLDLPLLAIATALFLGAVIDGVVTFGEGIVLLIGYGIYMAYTIFYKENVDSELLESVAVPKKSAKRKLVTAVRPRIGLKDLILLVLGIGGLIMGAKYLIDALVNLSSLLNVATGMIAITAVAVGTSLPELLVSAKAALRKQSEVALGNIFGSNIFNALAVVGVPALFHTLSVDAQTMVIGVPVLGVATGLFVISGISKQIHIWEGLLYVMVYVLFIAKLFAWF
jgi:cation:H+ antiporter